MVSDHNADHQDETRSFKVLNPGTMISHYRIIEKIGEGGMGVVYKARDTRLDRDVALKFLPSHLLCDSEAKARFEHEARAASALNNPNIATIYEIDEEDGRCFIAMEFLDGGSLKQLLKARELSIEETLDLAIQIAKGLSAAHESDVIHRDIKPDNVMLTGKGLAKIMDFGLAKLKGATKVTKSGTTLGTLRYMSPEQAVGKELDQRSDLFSFGVILYEMMSGRLPFTGQYEQAVVYSILNDTPEPLARYKAGVPAGLEHVVGKALEKDREERYQDADDLLADLKHERKLLERAGASKGLAEADSPGEAEPSGPRRRLLRVLIPVAIVCVTVVLIFIFEPFRLEMGPKKEAIARENSLAIMYFENVLDPQDQDKSAHMITSLLITDLSESEYMQVVSRQRLYDILRLLGREDLKIIDKTVASEIAEKAGVKWILTGELLRTDPTIALTSDISDAETGTILASQRITAEVGEDLFSVVDRLSARIKEDLSLPAAAQSEVDRPIADVTTHSPEAYRYYLEGLEYQSSVYVDEAMESFRKALEFDSTFAMAYYRLSFTEDWEERERMVAKAIQYSDHASWKEKQYIKAMEAGTADDTTKMFRALRKIVERYPDEKEALHNLAGNHRFMGHYNEAIRYLERAIEVDPLYKNAYNLLAYTHHDVGDHDRAIWAINKYISLAPDEPNPYDSRGDLHRFQGELEQAAESYEKANAIWKDEWKSLVKLGDVYLYQGEYAKAESIYQRLALCDDEDWRARGRIQLAFVPRYRGKLDEALSVLDDAIAADRLEKAEGWARNIKHYWKASTYWHKREPELALKEFEKYMELYRITWPDDEFYPLDEYIMYLANNGDFEKAEEVARELEGKIDKEDEWHQSAYWVALGYLELLRGNFEEASSNFEKIDKDDRYIDLNYVMGKAYLELGKLGEAVARFEDILSDYRGNRVREGVLVVKTHYLLGICYERSGWKGKAIEQYEEFLDIWKDADPGILEIEDARQRLARLKTGA